MKLRHNVNFEPETARPLYEQKDDEELIQIAYLESSYLQSAKDLARCELARRGLEPISKERIEVARKNIEKLELAIQEHELRSIESEEELPSWRRLIHQLTTPYRRHLQIFLVALMVALASNYVFEWAVSVIAPEISLAAAVIVGLVSRFIVGPTREELIKTSGAKQE